MSRQVKGCPYCKVVKIMDPLGPSGALSAWHRPALFVISVAFLLLIGADIWLNWKVDDLLIFTEESIWGNLRRLLRLVLYGLFGLVIIIWGAVSIKGCDACVSTIIGWRSKKETVRKLEELAKKDPKKKTRL